MAAPETKRGSVFQWAWIFYLILALAGIVWLGARRGTIDLSLFIGPTSWPIDLALGIAVGAALAGGWEMGRRLLPQAVTIEQHFGTILGPMSTSEAVALAVLSAIAEEFFFLQESLSDLR